LRRAESPTEVIERAGLLSTMMDEGLVEVGGYTEVKLPTYEVVWLEVPESTIQSVIAWGVKAIVLKELVNDC
jgi:hypothetical protein